jgi:hypothetical protein
MSPTVWLSLRAWWDPGTASNSSTTNPTHSINHCELHGLYLVTQVWWVAYTEYTRQVLSAPVRIQGVTAQSAEHDKQTLIRTVNVHI